MATLRKNLGFRLQAQISHKTNRVAKKVLSTIKNHHIIVAKFF